VAELPSSSGAACKTQLVKNRRRCGVSKRTALTLFFPVSILFFGSHVRTTVSCARLCPRPVGPASTPPAAGLAGLPAKVQLTLRGRKLSARRSATPVDLNPAPSSSPASGWGWGAGRTASGCATSDPSAGDISAGEGGPFCCLLMIRRPSTFKTDSSETRAPHARAGWQQRSAKDWRAEEGGGSVGQLRGEVEGAVLVDGSEEAVVPVVEDEVDDHLDVRLIVGRRIVLVRY